MVYKLFKKKNSGGAVTGTNKPAIKNETMSNQDLAEKLHKTIIRKFGKRKVYSYFRGNIWVAYLAYMQLISKYDKEFRFLLYVINIFSNYAWVVPLKDKKKVLQLLTLFKV